MIAPVFVDTNVFIYARDSGESTKRPLAAQWLEHLWRQRSGRTSMQVLSEYYVNVTGKLNPGLSPDEDWDDVSTLMAWHPLPIDRPVLQRGWEVHQRYGLSWWDSLIVAAAQLQDCALLLSQDMQDGAVIGDLVIRSPFKVKVEEARAHYDVTPASRSRHPPRGRPRRSSS